MFTILNYDKNIKAKSLNHSDNVFHEALEDGESYYHIQNPSYDISYKNNFDYFKNKVAKYTGEIVYPYKEYDENDKDSLDIEFLNSYSSYVCNSLTEYSIVIAKAVLKYTDKHVYFFDERIKWFINNHERLHINEKPYEDKNTIYLMGPYGNAYLKGDVIDKDYNKKSDIFVFHSLFYLQKQLKGKKLKRLKYFYYPLNESFGGIGMMIMFTQFLISYAKSLNLQLIFKGDRFGKLKIKELKKYFNLDFTKKDSTEANTLSVSSDSAICLTWRYLITPNTFNNSFIDDRFLNELNEYADAVIGNKSVLGVLIRGTDYNRVHKKGSRAQASVEEMIPKIHEWMEKDKYDSIFLATEDIDVLNRMKSEFGKSIVAIAQERHSLNEFKKNQIINELEKELYNDNEYDNRVIENTINYYYALFMLSKCDSFMCSGYNNGWMTANAMNHGKFKRVYKFTNNVKSAFISKS